MPKLLLKRKDVSDSVPEKDDLVAGELAINTADLKLFSLSADGNSVIQLAGYGFDHNNLGNLGVGDPHTQYVTLSPRATQGAIYRNTISSLVDTPELVIKRFRGQSQPLTVWQNEDGAVLAAVQYDGTLAGSGTNLYNLKASNLSIGMVAPANLGSGLPNDTTFLRGDNTWATIPPSGAPTTSKYIVQGTVDTNLTGAQFLGALATGIVKNNTNTGVLSIAVVGTDYLTPTGSGAGLTNLNASNLASGTVSTAQLGSGTANATTFLRGDNTWKTTPLTPPGGLTSQVQYNSGGSFAGAANLTVGSSGQLNFTPVPVPSPVNDGDLWYDNTRKSIVLYNNGLQCLFTASVYRQITPASALTNPTTATSLLNNNTAYPVSGPLTIPTAFWSPGRNLAFTGWPVINFGANGIITFRIMLDSIVVLSIVPSANMNGNFNCRLEFGLNCRVVGSSGQVFCSGSLIGGVPNVAVNALVTAIDLTIPHVFDIKVLFGTNNANNNVQLNGVNIQTLA